MTQLQTYPNVDRYDRAIERYNQRQEQIDAIIEQNRSTLSPQQIRALNEKRDRIRVKIGDINSMAISAIKRGVDPVSESDDRSAAVRFLDLIDLPRNTTANILFGEAPGVGRVAGSVGVGTGLGAGLGALLGSLGGPGGTVLGAALGGALAGGGLTAGAHLTAAALRPALLPERHRVELAARANRGALGQPSIYFSDALERMGVENKVTRGVVGFVGDVLLDPLTYQSAGGNAVTWMSRSGARVAVSKPASKILDDITRHVAQTGYLPTSPAYDAFTPLWRNTIKVGNEVIDVSGSGPALRERLLEAAERVHQIADPESVGGRQRLISQMLRDDLIESSKLNVLDPAMKEKVGLSRSFLERYAAKSDFALTIPGTGFLTNRLRVPLSGRNLDIQIGQFGRSGRLSRALEQARALDGAQAASDLSNRIGQFQTAREAAFRASIAEALGGAETEALKSAVARGVPMADTQLDLSIQELKKLSERADATSSALDAQHGLEILRGRGGDEIFASLSPLADAMDDWANSMRRGDAATSALGPSSVFRKFYGGTLNARHRAEISARNAMLERDVLERATAVKRREVIEKMNKSAAGGAAKTAAADADAAIAQLDIDEAALKQARQTINESYSGRISPPSASIVDIPKAPASLGKVSDTAKHRYVIGKGNEAIAAGAIEGRRVISHGGRVNTVDVKFAHPLDAILWKVGEATQRGNAVARAAVNRSLEYLQRVYGAPRSTIVSAARTMHKSVQEFIEQGIAGKTAGAAAAEGDRAFNMPLSKLAQRRFSVTEAKLLNKKGKLRIQKPKKRTVTKTGVDETGDYQTVEKMSFASSLITEPPKKIQAQLRHIERALTAIGLQRNAINKSKQTFEGLATELKQIDDVFEASSGAIDTVIKDNLKIVDEIHDSTLYRTFQKVMDAEQAIRDKFNIGRRSLDQKEIARLRLGYERIAPMIQTRVMRELRADFDAAALAHPAFNSEQIQAAWMVMLEDTAMKNSGVRAFARSETGQAFDDILLAADDLRKTEPGKALLNDSNLRNLSEKYLRYFEDDLRVQQSLGILPDFDPQLLYIHGMLTEKARIAMRDLSERLGQRWGGQAAGLGLKPGYANRKVTNRLFYGPNENDFIYVGELARLTPGDTSHPFEAWRQQKLQAHPELMQPGDLWDASNGLRGVENGDHWIPQDRIYITSAVHLNNHQGDFLRRVGDEIVGPLFEQDLLQTTARRVLVGERVKQFRRFVDEVATFAKPLTPDEVTRLPRGLRPGTVTVDGIEYKQMTLPGTSQTGMVIPLPEEMRRSYFPSAFVDTFNDWEKTLNSYKDTSAIIQAADQVMDAWRFFTLLHPSWMATNQIGGAFASATVAKTKPDQWIKYTGQTLPLILEIHGLKSFSEAADRLPHTIGEITRTRGEWKELMITNGIANGGRSTAEILTTVKANAASDVGIVDKAAKIKKIMPILGKWFQLNSAADDQWRAITYFSRLEMGDAAEAARELMVKAHFDFGDLSEWETRIGTRVWPFMRWMRNNIALQVRMLFERPAIAASFPKMKNALEELFDAEQLVPEELRPRWMKDNIAVQIASSPNAKFALLSIFTPIQELIEVGQATMGFEGFTDMLKYSVSSASPMIKIPIELAYGEELFTGREIGDPSVVGKMGRWEYLAQQFRPYRETARLTEIAQWPDVSALDLVTRSVFGGRIQHTTDDKLHRQLAFQTGETSNSIRRSITRSIREGDREEAERLSAKLIGYYRRLWNAGLVENVPKELRSRFARDAASR